MARYCRGSPWCNGHAISRGLCAEHLRAENRAHHPNASFYSSPEWQQLRARVLQLEPTCRHPQCNEQATDVDHITPIEEGGATLDLSNLQPLCHAHHSAKTWAETRARREAGG